VPGRIAVIEDDRATRELMVRLLQGAGYKVDTAEGGEGGVAVVEREKPDIVFLDLLMPGMAGLEICERIRSGPAGHTSQIVIISAVDGVEEKVRALEAGADDFLVKPVAPAELVARIKAMLSRAELFRQQGARTNGRLIAVAGAKGGIGTSSVALNLAAAQGQRKADSAAVADLAVPVGTLGIMLGLPVPDRWVWREFVHDGAASTHRLSSYLTRSPNLPFKLLPGVRQGSPFRDVQVDAVHAFATGLRALADHVFVDLGNQPSPFVPPIVRQADVLMVVVEAEVVCVELSAHLIDRLEKGGILHDRIRLVISNPHGSLQLSRSEVEAALKAPVLAAIPYQRDEFSAATKRRSPLVLSQPQSVAATQFRELAQEVAKV
jgi:DNA-binding response OmpR family regulator